MIDIALLRVIKYREQYDKIRGFIPVSAIDKKTKTIALDLERYFNDHPDESVLNFPAFRSLFFTVYHKGMNDATIEYYNNLLTSMEQDVPDAVMKSMINRLIELGFATNAANVLEEYHDDSEIDIIPAIAELVTAAQTTLEKTTGIEYADFDDSTVGESGDDEGYLWNISTMDDYYRRIQGGDQYIVAARPGVGKTSFLTHLCWSMASQMEDNKIILWFNNESRRQRIMSRQIQSALGMSNSDLAKLQAAGTMRDSYIEAMGRPDRVRVYDIHGWTHTQLLDIVDSVGKGNIGAFIFDMLDNVGYPTRKDVREDQRLEQLYQWSRELGVAHNAPVFPTSQVSNEGAGLMFPSENMLKDSKTGKQGACDGIIIIGKSDDPLQQNYRGISMPKTKSKRAGQPDMREEVLFDADRGRYVK
jgi:replicative DNA helicase